MEIKKFEVNSPSDLPKHPDIMLGNARLILLRHFNEMVSRLERKTDHSRAVLTAAQYGIFDINQLSQ